MSGGLPPATWVVSFWVAESAGTFRNLMVMLGWALWKSAESFFICEASLTHDWKVTVTGLVGSLGVTAWTFWPAWVSLPPPPVLAPTQAVATRASTATAAVLRSPRPTMMARDLTMPPSCRPVAPTRAARRSHQTLRPERRAIGKPICPDCAGAWPAPRGSVKMPL